MFKDKLVGISYIVILCGANIGAIILSRRCEISYTTRL